MSSVQCRNCFYFILWLLTHRYIICAIYKHIVWVVIWPRCPLKLKALPEAPDDLNFEKSSMLTGRPPIYWLPKREPAVFLGPWEVVCLPGTRDDHVVQSRDCRIAIATQYQTFHQQIATWKLWSETSLGVSSSILNPVLLHLAGLSRDFRTEPWSDQTLQDPSPGWLSWADRSACRSYVSFVGAKRHKIINW